MTDERPLPRFSFRRILAIIAVATIGILVGLTALKEPGLPQFQAAGEAIELETLGSFPSVTEAQFEGILVGLRGQVVVVNIWASWCAPCRTEMPLLQAASEDYDGRAVILGVASNDDPREAKRFLTDMSITYANVFDTSGQVRVRLGLTGYPTTYVFDAAGELRSRVAGGISEQRLAAIIEDALP